MHSATSGSTSKEPPHSTSPAEPRPPGKFRFRRSVAALSSLLMLTGVGLPMVAGPAQAAPVGQGFTVTASDLAFILRQIKIAEAHVRNTTSETGPCGALLGTGPDQVPGPLVSYGLRTVDGSCNNLQDGREDFATSNRLFPRLTTPEYLDADDGAIIRQNGPTTYDGVGNVVDAEPRVISNLIVDQTASNPAAISAAQFPVRSQGNDGVVPCDVNGLPAGCVPAGETLFIPNITTDVGLSPPYNSLFTIFGQFFDHGLDLVNKSGNSVFIPLQPDDPLIAERNIPERQRFMVLTRATNQPGEDGVPGTADDVREATNRTGPLVDQSQTYSSDPSHHVFLREYANNADGRPVSTGALLESPDGGMGTWKMLKDQAASKLGLQLADMDVHRVPMIAVDPYGNFIPGPARGLPQFVTSTGMVEGNKVAPVAVPENALRVNESFLDDIAHQSVPSTAKTADTDDIINPPGPPTPTTYDNEMLDAHFVAGDGRLNENVALTMIHQVFHSEHNRLLEDIKNTLASDTSARGVAALAEWKSATGAGGWNGERLFQAARFVTEMEYQHLAFEEFARKVQPLLEPFSTYHDDVDPAITAEFAHAVYRFGHSMLTDTVSRTNTDGSTNDVPLLDAFLNPPEYYDGGTAGRLSSKDAAGAIAMGMSDQVGNELDEFVTETLRNNLLGLPLDLAAINIARARETGIPSLNNLRREIYNETNDSQLKPYTNWIDFGLNLKHPESLINFVAAYGQHPTITAETTLKGRRDAATLIVDPPIDAAEGTVPADSGDFMGSTGTWAGKETGLNHIDLWMGGLAERTNLFGGLLGSTFNYVFEQQMLDLQNGDRFYYLARTPGMNLLGQLEGNSFAEMIMRNTSATALKADVFGTSDCKFELGRLQFNGTTVLDDALSECDEEALLIRMPDGTIRYRTTNSVDPAGINGQSVFNGTAGADRVWGGVDNDTFLGNEGDDIIEGNDGGDTALGGEGNDVVTDSAGDDVLKGGPGNDALDAGPGLDLILGADGSDFINGGANTNDSFGGEGNDFLIAGGGNDFTRGDAGDDWLQGGDGADLVMGDSGAPFFDDPNTPGNDILMGQNGDDDYDAEGGDDIMLADPGIERNAGAAGFDWATHQVDGLPADTDLTRNLLGVPLPVDVLRDRYAEVEALSGAGKNDVLRGDDVIPRLTEGEGTSGENWLDAEGVGLIKGLADLLPDAATDNGNIWGEGNIILGGGGSDLLEGRSGNDILDGDRELRVRMSVRTNPADPATEIGSTDSMEKPYLAGSARTLQSAVFAGDVDPGNIVLVREIVDGGTGSDVDVAVFTDLEANYRVTTVPAGAEMGSPGSVTTVTHLGDDPDALPALGEGDGIDTLRNVEQLLFSDSLAPTVPEIGPAIAGDRSATVEWEAPASVVTRYDVRVVDANGLQVGALREVSGEEPGVNITGLINGQSYRFQVRAVNELGASGFSALSNPVVPNVAPAAPTNVRGVPGAGVVDLSWTAPAGNTGTPVTSYRVQVLESGVVTRTVPLTGAGTTTTITGLRNGATYTFRVQAVNAAGNGALSDPSPAVTLAAGRPAAPTIAAPTGGRGNATVSWTPGADGGAPVTGFSVRVVDPAGAQVGELRTAPANARSLSLTRLPAGIALRFQVAATNDAGMGAFSGLSAPLAATLPPFRDVPQNQPFFTEIVWLLDNGITTGYLEDGTFRPYQAIKRDEMAAFMYRLAGEPAFAPPRVSPFNDIPAGGRFYKEVAWLEANGITTGYPDGTFKPHLAVNRDMMAAFMYRYAGEPAYTPPAVSPFVDMRPGSAFYKEVSWLASTKITTGYPDRTFRPFEAVNRDMMAAFMYRFDGLNK
ncbi:Ca2+-binding RTX toxin-like protein [Arthrobacter pigmenti]|uniref:Ca2+-binding RTX toxin-like protein n=1 Tax=Arthrobacter pigmenti TaxID=271432 RepID=A0A846RQ96_9MICC|nr:peroxidase family protein [Arthrobacter pigmenti]NJC22742.1 Ca2+-binding RTX toxin-like protein [Arthrobacter pigmenti]